MVVQDLEFKKGVMVGKNMREDPFCKPEKIRLKKGSDVSHEKYFLLG